MIVVCGNRYNILYDGDDFFVLFFGLVIRVIYKWFDIGMENIYFFMILFGLGLFRYIFVKIFFFMLLICYMEL